MTRRSEGPWAARRPAPREMVRCECGELTHEADGVCSRYCREKKAQRQELERVEEYLRDLSSVPLC